MDITTEAGAFFDNHPRLKKKARLLDITIVDPFAGFNLENAARHVEKPPYRRSRAKEKQVLGLVPRRLLPPSSCYVDMWLGWFRRASLHRGARAIRRVEHRSETQPNDLAEGTEVARPQRRFSFVVQQALSFRTRHHLCRQGVALASTRQLRSQSLVSLHAHRTEGVAESEGRKKANGVKGGDRSLGREQGRGCKRGRER